MTLPQIGSPAPHFEAIDQHGKTHRLSDYAGRKLLLYFYPKDDTPGCTAQACSLRDGLAQLADAGYAVLGVSTDDAKSHAKFAKKFALNFPLLADADMAIVTAYGVYGEKTLFGRKHMGTHRVSFVIDAQGRIERVIDKVDTKVHAAQVLGK